MPGRDTRSSWPGPGSAWLWQRYRNWRRVRLQRAKPVELRRLGDRRWGWWHPPNPRTSFPRHGAPGVKRHLAGAAIAGTTRKNDCNDTLAAEPGDIPPRAVVASHTYYFAIGDGARRSQRLGVHGQCPHPVDQIGKVIRPGGGRHNPPAEANPDPRQKLVAGND